MISTNEKFFECTHEFKKAIAHHQSGKLSQAEKCYQKILAHHPHHSDALHLLGVIAHQSGDSDAAVDLIKQAIRHNPQNPFYYNNLGAALREAGDQNEALTHYQKALQLKPDYAEAAYNIGSVFLISGNISEAIFWYQKAVHLKPDYVDAYSNLAAGYNKQNRPDDALICCQKALAVNPNCAEALNNMGNAFLAQGKQKEAIACFRKSIVIDPVNPEAYSNMGNAFHDIGNSEEAIASYQNALRLNPAYGEAYNNMGIVFREQGNLNEAICSYQKAMQLKPGDPEAYHNMGNVFKDTGQLNKAISMYHQAIALNSELFDSYVNLGVALEEQGRSDQAINCYLKALKINPEYPKAHSHLLHQLQHVCAWQQLEGLAAKLDELTQKALDGGEKPDEMPFLNLTRHSDSFLNYRVAKAWSDEISRQVSGIAEFYPIGHRVKRSKKCKKAKITMGYLSNNFKNHPTAHLIQGMFPHYNRDEFNIFCYSYGEDDKSSYRKKIKKECDRFTDLRTLSHADAASRIHDDHVDILVDLVGYIKANRLSIPALRPAPVQVRWLGMAGTTGADFFDYLITDVTVTPEDYATFYSESLVFMPHCYQINDNSQAIPNKFLRKSEIGLPEDRFIFCSFSSCYKFDPVMFGSWMKILKQVPRSVLWIIGSKTAEKNLMHEAEAHGVKYERIVFANKIHREEHLNRLRFADLSLDTRIVNGAITTSDALWSGVPVVTLQGNHFASRMSSSILSAVGLPEMVTYSLADYEALAIRLAKQPDELHAIRQKLVQNRLTMPLFDTPRFVRNIEIAFKKMWRIYVSGDSPRPIKVKEKSAHAL
jgi:protein O-GlcNAc transferase